MLDAPRGVIDAPAAGQTVGGPAVELSGWALFPGASVDYVDVFLDGESIGRASYGHPRPDILGYLPDAGVDALTSGFWTLIAAPSTDKAREYTFHVRATASDGAVWQSPETSFTVSGCPNEDVLRDGLSDLVASRAAKPHSVPRWCVFTHSLNLGGGELYLQELLLRVRDARAAEILVVAPVSGPLREELEEAGISVHVTAGYAVDPKYYDDRLVEYALIMQAWDTDVVIANTLGTFAAVDAARLCGVPAIWAIHESFELDVFSYLNWGPNGLKPAVRVRWLEALKYAELIFEADATLALHAREVPGISARKVSYGVDLDVIETYRAEHDRQELRQSLGFRPSDRVLLCMGVIQKRKGQIQLLRAFLDVCNEFPDAQLVLVGDHDAEYPAALRKCLALLDVKDNVTVVKIDPDTYRWYLAADVLISASDIESLPRSILEAQAFGLPVLAADVFGVGEVVADGVTGWVFQSRHGSAMAAALGRVLRVSDAELQEFSNRAREAGRNHDGSGYAKAYTELASQLCGDRRRYLQAANGLGQDERFG